MVFRAYSPDVKVLILRQMLLGKKAPNINFELGIRVHPDSMRRWMNLYRSTRAVVMDPTLYQRRGTERALDSTQREFLLEVLDQAPDLYLDELQRKLQLQFAVSVSRQTLSRELRFRLGMTIKVARTVHPGQSEAQRAAFIRHVADLPPEYLVFTDESAICADALQRRYAWAPKGRPTHRLTRSRASRRFSLLPAVSQDGVLGTLVQEGSILRIDFEYFLQYRLLPVMNPWPGRNSVLILDNARIHHSGRVAELCDLKGILVVYLPPYSPDLNPIEKAFAVLKFKLRRYAWLTGRPSDAAIITAAANTVISARLMQSLFRVCGY